MRNYPVPASSSLPPFRFKSGAEVVVNIKGDPTHQKKGSVVDSYRQGLNNFYILHIYGLGDLGYFEKDLHPVV